jgi:SAM-dependent methyltransferase
MPKFGTNLRQAASADDAKLKAFMDKLERGGVFKDFGINNFLEGDFFKWYVEAWDDRIAAAMRETIRVLANYSLITLDVDPNVTRDILKILYQGLVPKRLRHNLGEYYTPDWLAERLIDMTVVGDLKPTDKILDPACGSGTFLVLCIRKMREYARKKMLPESEVLDKILLNVVGFDLNPLAVISSRTNFLLALGDLLEHRKGDISIPVYLCDSVVTPHEGEDMFGKDRFKIKTAVGDFVLPKTVIRRDLIKRMAEVLEELVDVEVDRPACIERLASELMLDRNKNAVDLGLLADLYEQLLDKKRQHINGV